MLNSVNIVLAIFINKKIRGNFSSKKLLKNNYWLKISIKSGRILYPVLQVQLRNAINIKKATFTA